MKINYENRVVAFLDILGFKNLIKESENNDSKINKIYQVLEYLKSFETPDEWDLKFVEIEEDAQKKGVDSFEIKDEINCTCFSDSIVISIPLDNYNINEVVSTLVANLSYIGSILLENGILLRGGITLGNLVHNENGIIFGQALISAYELESRQSKYPRIILSDKLLQNLNYPLKSKSNRYPYHQYIKRYTDGCVGFNQLIYFQVVQSWIEINEEYLKSILVKIRKQIIKGLDCSFENSGIFEKYNWLKNEYNGLIIFGEGIKQNIKDLNEDITGNNIHFSYTDEFHYS